MPVIAIGTDLVNINRIKNSINKHPLSLAEKILSESEFKDFIHHKQSASFLAKRFAAKEAVMKAIGTGWRQGVTFKDIVVTRDKQGKPSLVLYHQALQISMDIGANRWLVSLSDERNYALAFVVATV